nr:reverse transcriptase domain-containing protein [Tanacetum cinerariifolium]
MSSTSSAVTYTSVYTNSEPGRVFWVAEEELSDGGSSRVIVYGYDGFPMLPVAPPSPDYVPSLKEPHTPLAPQDDDKHEFMFIQLHDPDFVPEPIYPDCIPLEDEHVLPAEKQPLPPIVSLTAESPEYVAESNPKEDQEEYEDDETEDGPDEDEEDEEEEEHLALADFAVVIPTDELVSPPEGTEPAAISFPPKAEVERLLAIPTPSPSPLASLSPPSAGERLARCTAPDASPLPPPLHMPLLVDRRDDIPETEIPPRKRLCLSTLGSKYDVEENSTARPIGGRGIDYGFVSALDAEARRRGIGEVKYGIRDTWVDPTKTGLEIAPMIASEVNTRVTELVELHEHDTHDLYALLKDAQDSRTHISQRVIMDSQRVDLLMKDKIAHQETIQIVEDEAYATREAWAHSIGLSQAVKENNVPAYTKCFQELTLICTKFVADETEKINKYVSRLPNNIYRSVKASKPKTLDETIELANDLMDQKLCTYVERQSNNKRKVNAPGWVYAVENAEKRGNASRDLDSNVVTGTFLLNNRYASILFDTGADRSSISTAFSSLIDIVPTPLGNSYDVELADAQEYMEKGCRIFLAQISAKKEEDRSEGKQLEDVLIVRDFPEVFPKDLPGLPSARPVEFQIDLILGAAPVARAPYRLVPSEMKELSKQLQELFDKGFIRPSSSP